MLSSPFSSTCTGSGMSSVFSVVTLGSFCSVRYFSSNDISSVENPPGGLHTALTLVLGVLGDQRSVLDSSPEMELWIFCLLWVLAN